MCSEECAETLASTPEQKQSMETRRRRGRAEEERKSEHRKAAERAEDDLKHERLADASPGSRNKRVRRADLTLELIRPTFDLPIKDAAAALHTSVNTLKRAARSHGIPSWPGRDVSVCAHCSSSGYCSRLGPFIGRTQP
jgi:hypothetical protein